MYRIKTLNKIAPVGLAELDAERFTVGDDVSGEDGILVRSAKLHDYAFPENLLAIARAGAGTNNIPVDRCAEQGIVVFNTPGANANAVKELVLCALLLSSRDVLGGADWVRQQAMTEGVDVAAAVEKAASAWGPSAPWCATSPCPWVWTCTAMTPSCLWTPPSGWTATSTW